MCLYFSAYGAAPQPPQTGSPAAAATESVAVTRAGRAAQEAKEGQISRAPARSSKAPLR
jgi:hypothetical protein